MVLEGTLGSVTLGKRCPTKRGVKHVSCVKGHPRGHQSRTALWKDVSLNQMQPLVQGESPQAKSTNDMFLCLLLCE